MQKQYAKAFKALQTMGVPVYTRDDMQGRFQISAEDAESYQWVDYYSQNPNWCFGVSPELEQALSKFGLFCEWINPGELAVCQA